jgi:hypothetical protein
MDWYLPQKHAARLGQHAGRPVERAVSKSLVALAKQKRIGRVVAWLTQRWMVN